MSLNVKYNHADTSQSRSATGRLRSIRYEKNTADFQVSLGGKKQIFRKPEKKLSGQEQMILEFKESNSPENNRITEIYNKFRSGQKLTVEELEYLAKESPDLYRQVREIIQERQAMEAQMRQAKTKEEVSAIRVNETAKIQSTMGTGEQAKSQAQKTMARANQMQAAYNEFTASLEYKQKEDIKSQTEEQREKLRALEEEQKLREEEAAEMAELQEFLAAEEDSVQDSRKKVSGDSLETLRDAAEILKAQERQYKSKKRKSAAQNPLASGAQAMTAADFDNLRLKVRDLYRTDQAKGHTSGGVDVSL